MADTLILNPTTPMAYLLPWMADVTTFAGYVIVGLMGAVVWDIAIHIDQDFKLVFKRNLSFTTGIYFLSRECTLIFALLNTIMQTTPLDGCRVMQNVLLAFYYISAGPTALLATLLVCKNVTCKKTLALLLTSWLLVLAGALIFTFGVTNGFPIGPSGYCSYGFIKTRAATALATFAVHGTLLFLVNALWRPTGPKEDDSISTASKPERMFGLVSRTIWESEQRFFFISALVNWAATIVCFIRKNPPSLWWSILTLNIVVTNFLFCRVHRTTTIANPSASRAPTLVASSKRGTKAIDAPMTFADPATISKGTGEDSDWTRGDGDSGDDSSILEGEKRRIYSKAFPGV